MSEMKVLLVARHGVPDCTIERMEGLFCEIHPVSSDTAIGMGVQRLLHFMQHRISPEDRQGMVSSFLFHDIGNSALRQLLLRTVGETGEHPTKAIVEIKSDKEIGINVTLLVYHKGQLVCREHRIDLVASYSLDGDTPNLIDRRDRHWVNIIDARKKEAKEKKEVKITEGLIGSEKTTTHTVNGEDMLASITSD